MDYFSMMKIRLKFPKSIFGGLDNTVLPTGITFLAKLGWFWYGVLIKICQKSSKGFCWYWDKFNCKLFWLEECSKWIYCVLKTRNNTTKNRDGSMCWECSIMSRKMSDFLQISWSCKSRFFPVAIVIATLTIVLQ